MNHTNQEKLSLLSQLILLAKHDNHVHEMEHQFLSVIAEQIGVSKEDFEALWEQTVDFDPPNNEFERIIQFHRLVLLSNIDFDHHPEENAFIRESGIRLGLNEMAINEVLQKMHDYENKVIPPDVLIGIFVKNLN